MARTCVLQVRHVAPIAHFLAISPAFMPYTCGSRAPESRTPESAKRVSNKCWTQLRKSGSCSCAAPRNLQTSECHMSFEIQQMLSQCKQTTVRNVSTISRNRKISGIFIAARSPFEFSSRCAAQNWMKNWMLFSSSLMHTHPIVPLALSCMATWFRQKILVSGC